VMAEWDVPDTVSDSNLHEQITALTAKVVADWRRKAEYVAIFGCSGPELLTRAQRLESAGLRDSALDLVYDLFDELFRRGHFALANSILTEAPECSTDLLVAIVTATLPAKRSLAARPHFMEFVERVIRLRGEWVPALLAGLE